MVIRRKRRRGENGMLIIDMMVGMAILLIAVLPLSYGMLYDGHSLRTTYQRAVAAEIVDGEMEALKAGDWRRYGEGTNTYKATAGAAASLPAGRFEIWRSSSRVRLEWKPEEKTGVGKVSREVSIP